MQPIEKLKGGLVYLASPYSDPREDFREARFLLACQCAAELMERGLMIFSPIAHTHPIAKHGLPKGWDFWEKYDRLFLEACSSLLVLMLPEWEASKGVQAEIQIVREMAKPVFYVDPETLVISDHL